jgi:hypothetical protein
MNIINDVITYIDVPMQIVQAWFKTYSQQLIT